jgi:LysM repeat protein
MRNLKIIGLPISLILLLVLSGCFQQGASNLDAFSVASNTNPTWTPEPGQVVQVTQVVEVEVPVVVTATTDPAIAAFPTTDFGVGGALPTPDPFLQVPPTTDFSVQPATLDPISVTTTWIIAQATEQEALNLTLTANPFFATPTPTSQFGVPDPGVVQPSPLPGGSCIHTVAAGENMFRIALRYGVSIDSIASASNVVNPARILVGQQLTIPGCGTTGAVPPPVTGDAGGGAVVADSGVGVSVGTGSCASPYTVIQDDTLFKISLRCGVPVMSIAAANNISNINLIVINQVLTIPAS